MPYGTIGPQLIHTVNMDNIDPILLDALIQTESSGNPNAFNKKTGARGLTQITPIAWKDLVAHYPQYSKLNYEKDIFNPDVAKKAAVDYIKILKGYLRTYKIPDTTENILGSYNWGVGNVKNNGLEKAPKETRDYIVKILNYMRKAQGQ